MSRATLEEFCRVSGLELKPEFFRRCQREFRDVVIPMLDERDRLLEENAELKKDQMEQVGRSKRRSEPVSA